MPANASASLRDVSPTLGSPIDANVIGASFPIFSAHALSLASRNSSRLALTMSSGAGALPVCLATSLASCSSLTGELSSPASRVTTRNCWRFSFCRCWLSLKAL
jgi:hypothetical protein